MSICDQVLINVGANFCFSIENLQKFGLLHNRVLCWNILLQSVASTIMPRQCC